MRLTHGERAEWARRIADNKETDSACRSVIAALLADLEEGPTKSHDLANKLASAYSRLADAESLVSKFAKHIDNGKEYHSANGDVHCTGCGARLDGYGKHKGDCVVVEALAVKNQNEGV